MSRPVALQIELIMPGREGLCRLVEVFENKYLRFKIGAFAGIRPYDYIPLTRTCYDTCNWIFWFMADRIPPVRAAGMYLDDLVPREGTPSESTDWEDWT